MSNKKRIDDRAALVLMADIIAWESVSVRQAARRALPPAEQQELASGTTKATRRNEVENHATRLERAYGKKKDALARLGRHRKNVVLREYHKLRAARGIVFPGSQGPFVTPPHSDNGTILTGLRPAIKRYEAERAKADSADIAQVADMLAAWAAWAQEARTPADAKARRLLLANHLEGFANLLRAQAPDIARIKAYDLMRQFRPD